jgi:hypothetical protein
MKIKSVTLEFDDGTLKECSLEEAEKFTKAFHRLKESVEPPEPEPQWPYQYDIFNTPPLVNKPITAPNLPDYLGGKLVYTTTTGGTGALGVISIDGDSGS